jgi:hypothetical protein
MKNMMNGDAKEQNNLYARRNSRRNKAKSMP